MRSTVPQTYLSSMTSPTTRIRWFPQSSRFTQQPDAGQLFIVSLPRSGRRWNKRRALRNRIADVRKDVRLLNSGCLLRCDGDRNVTDRRHFSSTQPGEADGETHPSFG